MLACVVASWGCDRPAGPIPEQAQGGAPSAAVAPERIVSTMPSTTEMVWRFGAFDRLVGASIFCDSPPEAQDLDSVGSGMDPDVERIMALRPDLVLGSVVQADFAFVPTLRSAGINVLLVHDQGLEEVLEDMPRLGAALGADAEERAQQLVGQVRAELDRIREEAVGDVRPSVLMVYGHDPIYAAGPDAFVSELLEIAGGVNALSAGDWVQLDLEAVVAMAPDVILEPVVEGGDIAARWARYTAIPAVRDGRIFGLRSPGVFRPGPSLVEATREIAGFLEPPQPEEQL